MSEDYPPQDEQARSGPDSWVAVTIYDVEVLGETGRSWKCRIDDKNKPRLIFFPKKWVNVRSTVRKVGDKGSIIIPRWLAEKEALI